tara:strand:+ start:6488 stop:7327 length:840 start_codon:yes stop_codon:yes gene_type:complete
MARAVKQKPKGSRRKKSLMSRLTPIEFDDYLKINIYGRSATGKTTFWSSFPGPILALMSSGIKKPGELRSVAVKDRKKIKQFQIQECDEVREWVDEQKETAHFKTVVLDHASSFQDLVLAEVLGIDELPPQSSWGMAKQQEYGQMALRMKEFLRALLGLENCNVIIIAQERVFVPDEDSELDIAPYVASAVSPSVVNWLNPAADYICETFIKGKTQQKKTKVAGKTVTKTVKLKGVDYCLRTAPSEVFTTKFRKPKGFEVPEFIVDPDYDKFLKVVNGE